VITVFYDGKCGLCSKEINHYRKIAPSSIFKWQDITKSVCELNQEGITLVECLKLLHAKDNSGQIHVGVDAFILIWKQLRRWRLLAFLVGLPIIRHIVNALYRAFANWRFKKLEHCQLALKQEKKR
jgi:predicted DCC family thiol-disulfide oxidoreductase YuxK